MQGVFLGGSISPGVDIRFRSLHDYTANLPEIEQDWNYDTPGLTTEDAIKSGVINGVILEYEGFIHQYEKKYGDLIVILTGGYYKLFESKTKGNIFAVPNLVMKGLHRILRYNVWVVKDFLFGRVHGIAVFQLFTIGTITL